MKLAGQYLLPGSPEKVWELLTDSERLAKFLPGCERLDPDGPDRYKAAIKSGTGTIEFAEKNPPQSVLMKLSGKAILGSIDASVRIDLAGNDGQTDLRYSGDLQVGGMMAAVGERMIEGTVMKAMDQLFASVADELKKA